MNTEEMNEVRQRILCYGYQLQPGLTDNEVSAVERQHAIRFPPDLRAMLQEFLPEGGGFPDWRQSLHSSEVEYSIRNRMEWPLVGMLFDIDEGYFWNPEWGLRPQDISSRERIATSFIKSYPKLIPIFGHRYIPEIPHEPGNPVFSIHQSDVIYYGLDLHTYFRKEYYYPDLIGYQLPAVQPRRIEFWSAVAELQEDLFPDPTEDSIDDSSNN